MKTMYLILIFLSFALITGIILSFKIKINKDKIKINEENEGEKYTFKDFILYMLIAAAIPGGFVGFVGTSFIKFAIEKPVTVIEDKQYELVSLVDKNSEDSKSVFLVLGSYQSYSETKLIARFSYKDEYGITRFKDNVEISISNIGIVENGDNIAIEKVKKKIIEPRYPIFESLIDEDKIKKESVEWIFYLPKGSISNEVKIDLE